jgi:hypothetical protein
MFISLLTLVIIFFIILPLTFIGGLLFTYNFAYQRGKTEGSLNGLVSGNNLGFMTALAELRHKGIITLSEEGMIRRSNKSGESGLDDIFDIYDDKDK